MKHHSFFKYQGNYFRMNAIHQLFERSGERYVQGQGFIEASDSEIFDVIHRGRPLTEQDFKQSIIRYHTESRKHIISLQTL